MAPSNRRNLTIVFLAALACVTGPTPSDLAALERAKFKFGHVFTISPRGDLYIEARYKPGGCPDEGLAEILAHDLLLEPDGSRRQETVYVYLNLWDDRRHFCFQLAYDPKTKSLEHSDQAYY